MQYDPMKGKHSPTVAEKVERKWLEQNRWMKLDLPTPESPTNTTLNIRCNGGSIIDWKKEVQNWIEVSAK